jgi:hypothetical protein
LLVEHLFLLVSQLHELSDLSINELLLDGLLLLESLFFLGFLEVVKSFFLGGVLLNSSLFLLLLDCDLSLDLEQFLVGLFELFSGFGYALDSFQLPLLFSLKFLFNLSFYQFALELVFFHLLDVVELESFELLAHALSILHLFMVFLLEFLS